jgi:uncharacterized membrane protein
MFDLRLTSHELIPIKRCTEEAIREMAAISKSIEVPVPIREAHNQWTLFESLPQFMEG